MESTVPTVGRARLGMVLAAALALTAAQTLLAVVNASGGTFLETWKHLVRWDGGWYHTIAVCGYGCPPVITPENCGNVGFFPGYPCCAWLVSRVTGIDQLLAMPLTAQMACVVFWSYLLLFLVRWQVPLRPALVALLVVATHPAAFYLVVAYSESVFLASILGFFYWSSSRSRWGLILAALHGILMTSTRLVGAPLVVIPLLQGLLEGPCSCCRPRSRVVGSREEVPGSSRSRIRRPDSALRSHCRLLPGTYYLPRLAPLACLGAVSSCGLLGYFAYCQMKFGHWDAYMQALREGWHVQTDYLAPFNLATYQLDWPANLAEWCRPQWLDHLATPVVLIFLVVLGGLELLVGWRRADTGWRWRFGLYSAILLLHGVAISGRSCIDLVGMVRYVFVPLVLGVLAACHLIGQVGLKRWVGVSVVVLLAPWMGYGFVLQMVYVWCYSMNVWVS
jgi:hypothetical protein